MTKRLFGLKDLSTNKLLSDFFSDKMLAKSKRKDLNPRDEEGNEIIKYVVTYGPDHRSYQK